MLLAAAGFVLSAVAHVASIAGMELPSSEAFVAMHAGVFVVFFPAVLVMQRISRGVARRDVWKVALSGCPPWMRNAGKVFLGDAILNFLHCMATMPHPAKHRGPPSAAAVRIFSGHWMVFYGIAFATLYSVRNRASLLVERRCPNQHLVSINADYCETCGERVPPRSA
jgi:hypothetical protein